MRSSNPISSPDQSQKKIPFTSKAYHFFSKFVYDNLEKEVVSTSIAELKSTDPLLGQISLACQKDGRGMFRIIEHAAKCALAEEKFGGSCYWYFGPEKTRFAQFALLVLHPNDVRWLLTSNVIDNSDSLGNFTKFLGNKNIFSYKQGTIEWRNERNRHVRFLDEKVIGKDLPKMREIANDYLKSITFENNKGIVADIEKFAADYTLETVAKTKLGIDHLKPQTKLDVSQMISKISVVIANQTGTFLKAILPFLGYFPFRYFIDRELTKLIKLGDQILKSDIISPNKNKILATTEENFITYEKNPAKLNLNSSEIINQFKEFLVVGHETTAKLLLFTLMLLADSKHAAILDNLIQEIKSRPGSPRSWSKEDFDQMPYLSAIIYETLRLYPPVMFMVNKIDTYCTYRDILLSPGDLVFISQRETHRYKPVWGEDADDFKPERFLPLDKLKDYEEKHMFFPFGFKIRKCVGQKFAILEVKQLVTLLVSEYKLSLPAEVHHPFPIEATMTLKTGFEKTPLFFEKLPEDENARRFTNKM